MRDQSPQSIYHPYQKDAGQRWRALVYLSIAELFALSLWFSATAVLPALSTEWQLSDSGRAGLTIAVQVGFIIGTLLSALGNLPDIYPPRVLMAISAAVGAVANGALALWVEKGARSQVTGRLFTILLAKPTSMVYPEMSRRRSRILIAICRTRRKNPPIRLSLATHRQPC